MSLKSKIDFAIIFTVKNANPNGDPLNGNRPRINNEGIGELSDVCVKRKIRDRLQDFGFPIFVQSNDKKNDDCKSLRERAEKTKLHEKSKDDAIKIACQSWYDVRAFGQLFAFKDKNKGKKKSGKEEGSIEEDVSSADNSVSIGIRGPVSIHPAFSIAPVNIISTSITKSVNGEGNSDVKKGADTMGMKHRVEHGTYVCFGSMSPQLAEKTGFSDADAETLKTILPKLFENDASSARPEGSMRVQKVIWWNHGCKSGKYSSAVVHNSLKMKNSEHELYELLKLQDLEPEIIDGF